MEAALHKAFYNLNKPSAFTGVYGVYKEAKRTYPLLKLKDVREWLSRQPSYTLHRQVVRKYSHNRYKVRGIRSLYQVDLMDMAALQGPNSGVTFLFTCIDVFSRFAWAVPIISKTSAAACDAFRHILREGGVPKAVQSDKGKEFTGAPFQRLLRQHKIHYYTATNPDFKGALVERFNRTLRSRIFRYLHSTNGKRKYLNALQQIVDGYNHTYHRSIKRSPVEVTTENEADVWLDQYGTDENRKPFRLNLGDKVRMAKKKSTFGRGFYTQWTDEIFIVTGRRLIDISPTYTVKDIDGNTIEGFFYDRELQKVSE